MVEAAGTFIHGKRYLEWIEVVHGRFEPVVVVGSGPLATLFALRKQIVRELCKRTRMHLQHWQLYDRP